MIYQKQDSFERLYNNIFVEEFCHDQHVTITVDSTTTQAVSLKFNENLTWSKEHHKLLSSTAWMLLIPFGENRVFARVIQDQIKLHASFAVGKLGGNAFKSYSYFDSNKKGNNKSFTQGFCSSSDSFDSSTRIIVDEQKRINIGSRIKIRYHHWRMAFQGESSLPPNKKTVAIEGYLGYLQKYWEMHTHWKDVPSFRRLTLAGLYRRNNNESYGVVVDFFPYTSTSKKWGFAGVVEYEHNESNRLKAMLNDKLNLTLLLKHIPRKQLAVSLGVRLPLDSTLKQKIMVGTQFDLNI